jgi:hypothetical protein
VRRTLRRDAIVICFGGVVVRFVFLRSLLDLDGWSLVAGRLLHVVVPLVALVVWIVFGPRHQATSAGLGPFLAVPVKPRGVAAGA